ncbi:MAG: pyridoxamine 5'-phosphate oxidase family protein [Candidatus Methanoplasma sp.]|jgi:nitroimidazol reductase NimA-like FMN-containing flavoprotein (pyridoxamine 5'-phosphate oxidase superfamily)|nr:pyridoxamine 5'-phosphate oxidase family protein [Candidatus Methanoplasma sp.]
MKTHQLTHEEVEQLLSSAQTGVLATLDEEGYPYAVPIQFIYINGKIYVHGLPKGQKIGNILRDGRVSFTTYVAEGLIIGKEGNPCDVNTQYKSVVVRGDASFVSDPDVKKEVLLKLTAKYVPQYSSADIPDKAVRGTGVIEIVPVAITGKYY